MAWRTGSTKTESAGCRVGGGQNEWNSLLKLAGFCWLVPEACFKTTLENEYLTSPLIAFFGSLCEDRGYHHFFFYFDNSFFESARIAY